MSTASPWAGMKAKTNLSTETPPPGTFPAILVGIIDLGTHDNSYQGKTTTNRQVYLAWELMEDQSGTRGGHHVIGKRFTLSFGSKAALRQLIEKWRGKAMSDGEGFDLSKLLGKPCLVSVVHTTKGDNTYAGVEGVSSLPKGMPAPVGQYTPFAWYIGQGEEYPSPSWMPYCFGEKLGDLILASAELKGKQSTAAEPHQAATNGKAPDTRTQEEELAF